jgi:hypothetical protein
MTLSVEHSDIREIATLFNISIIIMGISMY